MMQHSRLVILRFDKQLPFSVLPLGGGKDDSKQGLDTTRTCGFTGQTPTFEWPAPNPSSLDEHKRRLQAPIS